MTFLNLCVNGCPSQQQPEKPAEIFKICLPGQPEEANGFQCPNRSHIPVYSSRLQSSSSCGCVAGRSLLWVPWTEPLASVGLVQAGASEFTACGNDLQAAPDTTGKDRHSLQTLDSISLQERLMDNKRGTRCKYLNNLVQ